jgi:hypothetical protein
LLFSLIPEWNKSQKAKKEFRIQGLAESVPTQQVIDF